MTGKINISIPQPCHENWEAMTAVDKGKFCNSCQKQVFDFTCSSDREIVDAFKKDNNLCGRFLDTQLNRDLIKPKKKSAVWLATTSAMISLAGTSGAVAQEVVRIEHTEKRMDQSAQKETESTLVSGIVYGENKTPRKDLGIYIGNRRVGKTDENGNFSILSPLKVFLNFRNVEDIDDDSTSYYVKNSFGNANIEVNQTEVNYVVHKTTVGAIYSKRRTFFGRIFHQIGNLFR